MGNICGKEADAFSQPGRRLDEAPAVRTSAAVPASASASVPVKATTPKVGGPARTLGGSGAGGGGGGGDVDDARRRAAAAAEARAQGTKGGDLSKKLAEQKKLTHTATLKEASKQAVREREVDAAGETLRHG